MTAEQGLVLKRFLPNKQKVSCLSRDQGKITLVCRHGAQMRRLWPGSFFTFFPTESRNNIVVGEQVVLDSAPLALARTDVYWLHLMLEMCYFFLAPHDPAHELFDTMYCALEAISFFSGENKQLFKKMCVLKLLTLIGFYPEGSLVKYVGLFEQLLERCVDFADERAVDSLNPLVDAFGTKQQSRLDAWMLQCLRTHPHASSFKTIAFFDRI